METYTKLTGEVLNVMAMEDSHKQYLELCITAYREGINSNDFHKLMYGSENPVLARAPEINIGFVTKETYSTPLYQAVRDLQDRLDIQSGLVAADKTTLNLEEPWVDEWIPTSDAVAQLGISMPGVHKAIEAGKLISKPAKEEGKRLVISRNSARAYQLNQTNRANGTQGGRPSDNA